MFPLGGKITNTGMTDLAALTVSTVLRLGGLYVVLRIIDTAANFYMQSTGHIMGTYMETDMRRDLFRHLQELPHANDAGKEALLDVLSNFPGNEQVFQLALRLFRENPTRRALFAGYLGKLGDERALDDLMKVALDDTVGYLDFIELRNAIESQLIEHLGMNPRPVVHAPEETLPDPENAPVDDMDDEI